jgi:hypothetical protein
MVRDTVSRARTMRHGHAAQTGEFGAWTGAGSWSRLETLARPGRQGPHSALAAPFRGRRYWVADLGLASDAEDLTWLVPLIGCGVSAARARLPTLWREGSRQQTGAMTSHRLRAGLAAMAGGTLLALAASAPPALAGVTIPHYTMYSYKVTVGVKGGEAVTNAASGPDDGDVAYESASGSFSIDSTMTWLPFFLGRLPRGMSNSGNGYGKAVVNGSWSSHGTKWSDVPNQVTTPFTCAGTINFLIPPSQMQLSWKQSGSKLKFTLTVAQSELTNVGNGSCPPDSEMSWLQANDPLVYRTQFTLPIASIGRRSLSTQVSGPLAQNRLYFLENCPPGAGSSCSLAWQGTVRFTRTRVFKIG